MFGFGLGLFQNGLFGLSLFSWVCFVAVKTNWFLFCGTTNGLVPSLNGVFGFWLVFRSLLSFKRILGNMLSGRRSDKNNPNPKWKLRNLKSRKAT